MRTNTRLKTRITRSQFRRMMSSVGQLIKRLHPHLNKYQRKRLTVKCVTKAKIDRSRTMRMIPTVRIEAIDAWKNQRRRFGGESRDTQSLGFVAKVMQFLGIAL